MSHVLDMTRTNHAPIWNKIRQFDREAVLYAFRFDNGKTKVGLTKNILSRTDAHLSHGITGCVGVSVVRCPKSLLRDAEERLLSLLAECFEQKATEVFASSDHEETDMLLLEAVVKQVTAEHNGEQYRYNEDGDQCVHDRLDAVGIARQMMQNFPTKAQRDAINENSHRRALASRAAVTHDFTGA